VIEFPPFRLDLADERLWRGDAPVALRPKTLQVLRYLAERPGRLVTRDELLDVVWPDVAVAPETLTQVIAELRRALEDDARRPVFIQTVHRRGFRFIAEPRASHEGEWAHAHLAPERPPDRRLLVGRDAELARLGEVLQQVRAGRRQVVFVTGEPGIGKTSLVRTFAESLADAEEPVWIVEGRCIELHGAGEAYLPFLEVLERLAREAGAQRVVRCLSQFAPCWLAQLPWLSGSDEARATPGTTPTRMLREFCRAVEALSEERTLVLWLEDFHWSDASSVDLLAALAARPDPARLLVLAPYRPVDAAAGSHPIAPLKRSLRQQGLCEDLSLDPLDEASVRAYLGERLAGEPDPHLAALIHEQTEGNPLFMATLIEHLIDEGSLEHTTEGWKLSVPLEAVREETPESLGALVETQLDRLNAEELELLLAGSVVGQTFAAQAVAAATGRDVETVEKVCGRLAGWGRFLDSAGPSHWPDGSAGERYCFLHAVFRHVLYRRLPAGLRQPLHHRIGVRLAKAFESQPAAIAAEVSLHFERGGDPERAVQNLIIAAAGVRQRCGDREAVAYFERALSLLAALPESAQRDRRELELRMHLWREVNASVVVSAPAQDASLERALELCASAGDARARAYISSYRTLGLIIAGELDAAEALDEQRVASASSIEDPVLLSAAHDAVAYLAFYRGQLEPAQQQYTLCVRALEGLDPQKPRTLLGHDPGVLASGHLAWTRWLQGCPDQARLHAGACLERSKAVGDPLDQCFALSLALFLEQLRRDARAAGALAKPLVELMEESGFELPYAQIWAATGWTLAHNGEADAALGRLREGISASRSSRVRFGLSHLLAVLAETELERGRAKPGLSAIDEARGFVEETGERFWEAEIHRIRGELLRLDRRSQAAEACFQKALEVSRAQGALSLELRAATSLARLRVDAGHGQETRPLLAEVYARFSEGFDTADLQDAQALLDSL
jgi:DNA-binding winged helix-turn-helix (wHTH) protein/tetratricopeptide (TPR) repeat protein